jgi:hypothetical protein
MAKYDFPTMKKNDTFPGIQFTINVNGLPIDLTNAIVRMDIRETPTGNMVERFTSVGNAGITISATPTDGIFIFNEQIISVPAFNYVYDIEIDFQNNLVETYLWGNFPVSQDVTYD